MTTEKTLQMNSKPHISLSARFALSIILLLAAWRVGAVVTPAPDRAFCQDPATGDDIVARMQAEAGNPLLAEAVVYFANFTPAVDVDGDGVKDFEQWSGVLVAGYEGLDWWLAKYDTTGHRLWVQSYHLQANLRDLATGTAENGDPEF